MPEDIRKNQKIDKTEDKNEQKVENGKKNEKKVENLINENDDKDYKVDLQKEFDTLQDRNRMLNSKKIIDKNKIKEAKIKAIQELFGIMEEMGVDPNNLESINSFLATLEEQDPDLKALFEYAFTNVTEEDAPPSVPQVGEPEPSIPAMSTIGGPENATNSVNSIM